MATQQGRKGRGGGRRPLPRLTVISMALSKVLRHDAQNMGLKLDDQAFANLQELLDIERIKPLEATVDEVKQLVQEDKKQRFTLIPAHTEPEEISNTEESAQAVPSQFDSQSPSDWKIRANQGHTVILATNDHLTPMTAADLPAFVIHGTYYCFWKPILESGGLSTMNRNHIHFTTNLPEEGKVLSGSRLDAQLFIFVDVRHALQGGIRFWKSSNGVILTEGNENGIVPMQYVDRAQPRKAELGLLWENGKLGQELPEDLANARPPQVDPQTPLRHLAHQVRHNLQHQHDWQDLHIHDDHEPPQNHDSPLPRPLISGVPPFRLYIHPDDKNRSLTPEREWVLPTSLYEKWSLRKMAAVFEGVEAAKAVGAVVGSAREVQRVVVASVASDSTVTYYIVHDGVVKPRQN